MNKSTLEVLAAYKFQNVLCLTWKLPTSSNKALTTCPFPLQMHKGKCSRDIPTVAQFAVRSKKHAQNGVIISSKNKHNWQSENEADNNLACHMFYLVTYIPNINAKMWKPGVRLNGNGSILKLGMSHLLKTEIIVLSPSPFLFANKCCHLIVQDLEIV